MTTRTPDTCYFDGQCGLCQGTGRVLRRLDVLGRLQFEDMTAVDPARLPVPWETAMRGMPMQTGDGRVLVGFSAVRRALVQTPLGALAAWVLYVPGVSWVGTRVYNGMARRRRRACSVPMGTRGLAAP